MRVKTKMKNLIRRERKKKPRIYLSKQKFIIIKRYTECVKK